MNEAAVAIGAFDPALVVRDRQPDARMAQSPFATVTGHTPGFDDLGFRGGNGHCNAFICCRRALARIDQASV